MAKFHDLHELEENDRITMIGATTISRPGKEIAFVVDAEPPGEAKAERYIAKLTAKFPKIKVIKRFTGPTPGVYTVIVSYTPEASSGQDQREQAEHTSGSLGPESGGGGPGPNQGGLARGT